MRKSLFACFVVFTLLFLSCRTDFDFVAKTGTLGFSKDTVYLDTVFSSISTSTYTLKVYNRSNENILIPQLKLAKENASKYRIMVDGMTGIDSDNSGIGDGKVFENVELLAKDSMFIFIEATADINDANPADFLYTDEILFGTPNNYQKVNLVTLIQDAYFIYPNRENGIVEGVDFGFDTDGNVTQVQGRNLSENHPINGNELVMTNEKPYVIYGYASVPEGKTLTINPGARLHFHAQSGMIVQANATLKINGALSNTEALENEVIFEGDRLEPFYSDIAGQWGFIYFRDNSKDHEINHLTLKNAIVGFLVQNNAGTPMKIRNSQFYNCSNVGLLARFANIEAENSVWNNAGQASVALTFGGSYDFKHCTINNNFPESSQAALIVNNYFEDNAGTETAFDLSKCDFTNCIIYGSGGKNIQLDKSDLKLFNYSFTNNLVRISDGDPYYNNVLFDVLRNQENGNIKNRQPGFFNLRNNQMNIDETSPAVNAGTPTTLGQITTDILGRPRPTPPATNPDIGAYQNAPFPED
ncbi:choice-of-anchor Q domain-containing protein [Flavobacterium sp.]|uniref:choice-of-anchor Q domain-containing protein n=1 Tax=Flavobacterium sp. TaxID=239 RepID=UPI00261FA6ED|nr:choice-of-anchor Q domain-containing protein [Flavobacterium sp.]